MAVALTTPNSHCVHKLPQCRKKNKKQNTKKKASPIAGRVTIRHIKSVCSSRGKPIKENMQKSYGWMQERSLIDYHNLKEYALMGKQKLLRTTNTSPTLILCAVTSSTLMKIVVFL